MKKTSTLTLSLPFPMRSRQRSAALPLLAAAAIAWGSIIPAQSAESTFTPDGRWLWAPGPGNTLVKIEATTGLQSKPYPWPKALQDPQAPDEIHLTTDGEKLLLAARGKIWRWDPDGKPGVEKPVQLAPLPPEFWVKGLSRVPAGQELPEGTLLISGFHTFTQESPAPESISEADTLYGLAPGDTTFRSVFVRRLQNVTASPAFGGGTMVFGGDHDLWQGSITPEEPPRLGVLSGHRTAPLAMANTDMANSGSMGVTELAIASDRIWAVLSGRHMASLVSVPLPKKRPSTDEHPGVMEAWQIQRESLEGADVTLLTEAGNPDPTEIVEALDNLTGWQGEDGSWKLSWRVGRDTLWLWQSGWPKPKPLAFTP